MKGGLELGVGDERVVRLVMEEGMSQGTAQVLVKEDEEDSDPHSLVGAGEHSRSEVLRDDCSDRRRQ